MFKKSLFSVLIVIFLASFCSLSFAVSERNFEFWTSDPQISEVFFFGYSSSKEGKERYYEKMNYMYAEEEGIKKFFISINNNNEIFYNFIVKDGKKEREFADGFNNLNPLCNGRSFLRKNQSLNKKSIAFINTAHFDIFYDKRFGCPKDISVYYEIRYKRCVENLTYFFGELPTNGKIRYYSRIYRGMWANSGTSEIFNCPWEADNKVNIHELVHILLKYPRFGPFSEGIAQCFQEYGNSLPLKEPNCNLECKSIISSINLSENIKNFKSYRILGSFIYWSLFVDIENTEKFISFLQDLNSNRIPFDELESYYLNEIGRSLEEGEALWKEWLKNIDSKSNVYVNWQLD